MNLEQIDTSTTAGKAEVMRLAAKGREVAYSKAGHDEWAVAYYPRWDWSTLDYAIISAIATQWQPIETAPRDGTVIDLWAKAQHSQHRVPAAMWFGGEWTNEDGNYHSLLSGFGEIVVTHWMPLPAPPEVR